MKLYFTLNRSVLAFLLLFSVLAILIFGEFSTYAQVEKNGNTNQNRIDFIKNLGYEIDDTAINVKEIRIPDTFSDVYEGYNELQQKAGYDLKMYCGCKVMQYTYQIKKVSEEGPSVVNLLVFGGKIIGGDVASLKLDGEMLPLVRKYGKIKT